MMILSLAIVAASLGNAAADWPPLPDTSGEILVPAQSWPRQPGQRTVNVYIRYPGGAIANVRPSTGLMLSLHNWGGTGCIGTANPDVLANRYDVVAISVDYLQSGPYGDEGRAAAPYDFGYLQALDALRALSAVWHGLEERSIPFARGRSYVTGGSGGGNVTLMCNKLAPRTFACAIDVCGMAKLADDLAFGRPGRTHLNAGYSPDPEAPAYLNADAQALRFAGHPEHAAVMKRMGNACKLIVIHGLTDASCPVEDAKEMVTNLRAAGLDVEPHFITAADLDGKALTSTGHALGDRTLRVLKFADPYLTPGSPTTLVRTHPSDFERPDLPLRYDTPNGAYVISYASGYPVGRFERK